MYQQTPQYIIPEVDLVPEANRTGEEYQKATYIQSMNMDYNTEEILMNLMKNLNQGLPGEGSMFVYP